MAARPSSTSDCIIVGGGVIGLSVARRLAAEGLRVTVVDRGPCGRQASWAGAGVLTPPNPHRKDAAAELLRRSLATYPEFCARLHEESDVDCEYDRCAEIELAFDDHGLNALREDANAAAGQTTEHGQPVYEMLVPADARSAEPAVSPEIIGAMICRHAARVRNPRLLRALQTACVRAGVTIRENAPVAELIESAGRVIGIRLGPDGRETAQADRVILCAGAWSSQFAARLDDLMPVRPVRGQMVLLKLNAPPFANIIARGRTYLVPRRDGHVLLGATEERDAGFSTRNTARGVSGLIARGLKLVPSLADTPLVATWAGLRPGTPDDLPYLGPVPGLDGLIAATGHFRTGLTAAPATAEVIAATIAGRPCDLDLSACLPGRFSGR